MSEPQWPRCKACGLIYNPAPQNSGDEHSCGPKSWAAHQAAMMQEMLEILRRMDDRQRTV